MIIDRHQIWKKYSQTQKDHSKMVGSTDTPVSNCPTCMAYVSEVNKALGIAKAKINQARKRKEHIRGLYHG